MSNSAEETVVTVEHTDEPTTEAPTVVVADTGGDTNNDLEIGAALGALTVTVEAQGQAIAAINERLDTLTYRAESAEETASTAVSIAVETAAEVEEAVEEAVEAAEEVAEEVAEETATEEVDELIEPQREHFIWRKPVRLRRGVDA